VALVVFLRGVNVRGHRIFRPTKLAEGQKHLGAVNIGAAGALVIRRPVTQAHARTEVARKLPFDRFCMRLLNTFCLEPAIMRIPQPHPYFHAYNFIGSPSLIVAGF
jgi:hypothetical protein